ncbi:hypothetical protein K438DRAFT_1750735 [Mycena galopus ATCC 62051]|nr:hypothetical protein K438DRAFT_1750735 [Mycena galopus ATCC 62051]
MLFRKATFLALLSAATVIAQEVHGNITFEVQFNATAPIETTDIKDAYEAAAAAFASRRLHAAIKQTGIGKDCLTDPDDLSPTALYALKDCIAAENQDDFFALLASDIAESNTFWSTVVNESTTNLTQFIPARTYVTGYFGDALSATTFAEWTLSPLADAANLNANPEHYVKETQAVSEVDASSEIFEGWGGVLSTFGMKRTNFTIPSYVPPVFDGVTYPTEWAIDPSFAVLLQRIGPKVLASGDGQTFGYLHIAVRDVPPSTVGGMAAIEVYAAVWYPPWDQAPNATDRVEFQTNYLADEAHHMVVEIINLTLQAAAEIAAGDPGRRSA